MVHSSTFRLGFWLDKRQAKEVKLPSQLLIINGWCIFSCLKHNLKHANLILQLAHCKASLVLLQHHLKITLHAKQQFNYGPNHWTREQKHCHYNTVQRVYCARRNFCELVIYLPSSNICNYNICETFS